ncbi:MAG: nitroreductase family protein [Candidatus Hodarchaeales archaeon]|jgi:nitroreductase
MNETINIINNRRSIRSYADKVIPQDLVDIIINSAMRAPTAGNMMLYSILQVKDQDKKDRLVKTCDNQPFIAKAPLVLIFLADMQRWYDFYKESGVPEFCVRNKYDYRSPQESDLLLSCCDALIAAQNAVIAAESLGIGSCYVGDIVENIEIHREMFDLPRWAIPIVLLCLGYPKRDPSERKLTARFPEKFIHFTDTYERFSQEEFQEMFHKQQTTQFNSGNYLKNAENIGQHYFIKKTGSDFAREMSRSVKVAIKDWIKEE